MREQGYYDVAVIGGGPAGMAAAIAASEEGAKRVAVIERDETLGGILLQCIHNGFGAVNFGKDFPGPQYAREYENKLKTYPVDIHLDTMVLDITQEKDIFAMSSAGGYMHFRAAAIVLAMGCRERTRAQIRTPGSRPAGVFTAGTVQRLVNIEGYIPGERIVVLGSGDIGMIMARRLTIEGAKVPAVLELLPYLTGLRRNYVQCLKDYDIPLRLSTTVNKINGKNRIESVETIKVDENFNPVEGTEETIECDTLILSVGLIPENELSRKLGIRLDRITGGPRVDSTMMTSIPGVFSAGNVTAVYDLVDYVSRAGETAGRSAARYAAGEGSDFERGIRLRPGGNVGVVVPQVIKCRSIETDGLILAMRPSRPIEDRVTVEFRNGEDTVFSFREQYARPAEMIFHRLSERETLLFRELDTNELEVVIS